MPVFPSPEWLDAYTKALAAHPDARRVAESLEGVYRFVIEPGGPLRERHVYGIQLRAANGKAPAVTSLGEVARDQAELSIAAAYPYWKQLITGTLDLALAMMLRRVKVGGNLQRLTGRLTSAQPLIEALRAVDTQWLDER